MATKRRRRTTGIKKHVSPTDVKLGAGQSRGPRVGRDGKAKVPCPGCGSEYLVPEAALDDELACRHCRTRFVPRNAHRQRPPEKFDVKPYAIGGTVLAILMILYFAMRGGDPVVADTPEQPAEKVLTGMDNPRVRDARAWGEALAADDTFNLGILSDVTVLSTRYGVNQSGPAAVEAVVAKLREEPELHWFEEFQIDSAQLEDLGQHDASAGRVILYMTPRPEWSSSEGGKPIWYRGRLELALDYRFRDNRARIGGWSVKREPVMLQKPQPSHKAHEAIGEATTVKRNIGGVVRDVVEANIVPLPHLESTPDALRKEIDALVVDVVDIEGDPRESNRAIMRLREIGKPSIPRLLTKMYEIKMDSRENILRLRRVCQALEDITGQRFAYSASVIEDPSAGSNEEMRLSALRQWYGYWTTHHDREDWDIAIEKEESLDAPPPKQTDRDP